MLTDLKPKDFLALITILAVVILKLKGFNGVLDSVFALIVGYYFAHRVNKSDTGV